MNNKGNHYRLLFEKNGILTKPGLIIIYTKNTLLIIYTAKGKSSWNSSRRSSLFLFLSKLKVRENGQQIKIMQLVLQHVAKQVGRSVYVILSKNDDDDNNDNNNNNNNKNCENIDSLTFLFLVALGSDYSGAFRSEEDLRAMDDDIKKWYNVGNFFSKKIHLFSSFGTSAFPKKSDGSPPPP